MMLHRKLLKICLICAKTFQSKSYMKIYNDYLRACRMDVKGDIKYIHPSVYLDLTYAPKIHVGDKCVMSVSTIVLAHDFSIECGMTSIGLGDPKNEKKIIKDVYIGNNVFIGAGCVILPGTHIGDNCIIGAGTVCSGHIPEGSIVVGEKWRVISNIEEWTQLKRNQI